MCVRKRERERERERGRESNRERERVTESERVRERECVFVSVEDRLFCLIVIILCTVFFICYFFSIIHFSSSLILFPCLSVIFVHSPFLFFFVCFCNLLSCAIL